MNYVASLFLNYIKGITTFWNMYVCDQKVISGSQPVSGGILGFHEEATSDLPKDPGHVVGLQFIHYIFVKLVSQL